ncbi:hypothetical protein [Deinococcus maricopensis]|uniref:Uncharacterized protein n=1 Tax=Deinococcus maricopensis (strain DSM 21211 / LMG 22137 / NRRL B-23946 / LB-34) TaxID=709986 RepID=E8U8G8_DEIML|nr:hypothetical protein [Deinococcus maricopensis]ADV67357.1 hypothetical protein Deima_1708 [Deinococcus maricopensis DSM 21211]
MTTDAVPWTQAELEHWMAQHEAALANDERLQAWLRVATHGLAAEPQRRLSREIREQVRRSAQTHQQHGRTAETATVAALTTLGDPRHARVRWAARELTAAEERSLRAHAPNPRQDAALGFFWTTTALFPLTTAHPALIVLGAGFFVRWAFWWIIWRRRPRAHAWRAWLLLEVLLALLALAVFLLNLHASGPAHWWMWPLLLAVMVPAVHQSLLVRRALRKQVARRVD